ncbi:hypothetical protein HW511_13955 [Asaia siamensis]|uniref:hypothetical protein n=1 Tax=Asaia TaxID=91914 RepID=UPI00166689A3|nr:hypothetical protein [Asaia siamensis]
MSHAPLFVLTGVVLSSGAGVLFYLASHQQQILPRRLPFRPGVTGGIVLSVLTCLAFSAATSPLVGIFMSVVALMTVTSLFPLVVALAIHKRRPS